jgi:hypothetical protein
MPNQCRRSSSSARSRAPRTRRRARPRGAGSARRVSGRRTPRAVPVGGCGAGPKPYSDFLGSVPSGAGESAARCSVRKRGSAWARKPHGSRLARGHCCRRRSPPVSTESRLRAVCAARRSGATCTPWRSANGDGVRGSSTGASMSAVETVSLAALAGLDVQPNTPAVDVVAGRRCRPVTDGVGAEVTGVDAYGFPGHCVRVCWSARCDVHGAYARTYGPLPDGGLRATWRAAGRRA